MNKDDCYIVYCKENSGLWFFLDVVFVTDIGILVFIFAVSRIAHGRTPSELYWLIGFCAAAGALLFVLNRLLRKKVKKRACIIIDQNGIRDLTSKNRKRDYLWESIADVRIILDQTLSAGAASSALIPNLELKLKESVMYDSHPKALIPLSYALDNSKRLLAKVKEYRAKHEAAPQPAAL